MHLCILLYACRIWRLQETAEKLQSCVWLSCNDNTYSGCETYQLSLMKWHETFHDCLSNLSKGVCILQCRSLDTVTPLEPRLNLSAPSLCASRLSQEQHDFLDEKICDALHSAGMFNLEIEEGNKVTLPAQYIPWRSCGWIYVNVFECTLHICIQVKA